MEGTRHCSRRPEPGRSHRSGFVSPLNRDRIPGFHEDFSTMAVSACVTVRHWRIPVTHQCP